MAPWLYSQCSCDGWLRETNKLISVHLCFLCYWIISVAEGTLWPIGFKNMLDIRDNT